MNIRIEKSALVVAGLLAALALGVPARPAGAQPDDQEIHQLVARVSYISGDVSFSRGDDPDNWQTAAVNAPLTLGDRLYSGDGGRVELALRGGDYIRMASGTDLSALNLTEDVRQFSLAAGTAAFYVRRLEGDETFEVDTPNVAVTFDAPGDYRIDVDQDGNSRVQIHRGHAIVAAGGGQVPLEAESEMRIDGVDAPQYDIVALSRPDSFDVWVNGRQRTQINPRAYRYVNPLVVGAEDLDRSGNWENIPGYGYCWTPADVNVGWAPYRAGHWVWIDPWGWNWISDEPWGWAPYHYGRWVPYSSRWYWVPVGPSVSYVHYSPALVAFVGGGPGWSASFTPGGGGYVGWFPLGPRDPFIPWWGPRTQVNVNVTNITYMNRSYVTVVNRNTFVSGAPVATSVVRDPAVVRQVSAAPVIRGALPVAPTASSLRVAARPNLPAPARPPERVASRSVVTRVAPPPAPPKFESKLAAIAENRGAPLSAAASARLSVEAHSGARPATPVRPVEARPGSMTFQPRRPGIAAKPQPVTAPRGRALATAERPVVAAPAEAAKPSAAPPARIAPGAVVTRPAPEPAPAPKPQPRSESWRNAPPPPVSTAKPPAARPAEAQKPLTRTVEPQKPAPRPVEERKATPPPQPRPQAPPPAVREAPPRTPQQIQERRPATETRPASPPPGGKSVKPEEKKPQKPLEKKDDKDKKKDPQ